MNSHVPNPSAESCTDSLNSPLFDNAVRIEIPPERRKVDPATISWPEGIPKPWEQNNSRWEPPSQGE